MAMKQATIVVDLGYGDAGKGSMVDYYTRLTGASTVIRFNGGAQAAHRVVLPDGREHIFSQFGSGTFVDGVNTHLSRYMLVDPLSMMQEAKHLEELGVENPLDRISIDEHCPIITPFHRAANRIKERLRGKNRHGSCGMGIGEVMADILARRNIVYAKDLGNKYQLKKLMKSLQQDKFKDVLQFGLVDNASFEDFDILSVRDCIEEFSNIFFDFATKVKIVPKTHMQQILNQESVIFEGAQGVLIDEWHGFHPYTTWSTTTFRNALRILHDNYYDGVAHKIGITRAYMVRHGPGPFVTEDHALSALLPDKANTTNEWQREFRVGHMDIVALKYAIEVCGGVDGVVITCMDRIAQLPKVQVCGAYASEDGSTYRAVLCPSYSQDLKHQEMLTQFCATSKPIYDYIEVGQLASVIERYTKSKICGYSYGETHQDKKQVSHKDYVRA